MNRRNFVLGAAVFGFLPNLARAHHGWGGFDTATPVYLAGTVKESKWRNPHAELVIEVPATLALPQDLGDRTLPAQRSTIDGPDILRRTLLPQRPGGDWTIELAPLLRISQWRIEEIGRGEAVEAIGYVMRMDNAPAYMRAEYLFHAGRVYGLRSAPA